MVTKAELEILLSNERIYRNGVLVDYKNPEWLKVVRLLPCMCKDCGVAPARTVHHVFNVGIGMRCDDRLTIPLCFEHHVFGSNPVQDMNDDQFESVIGLNKKDAVRRVYRLIMDKIEHGDLV